MFLVKDKLVGVLGAGIEGISSAKFLKSRGAFVTILDQKTMEEIQPEFLNQIKDLNLPTRFGKDCLKFVNQFEILVRTPGIRPDVPELVEAVKQGRILTSNTKIFFEEVTAKTIGVTGTKGKGTTSTLIYEILKASGRSAFLGGNIGTPALDLLPKLSSNDFVVLELSSFQLFDLEKSPNVAVVLMVTSEHLDWHKDHKEYKEAKFNIANHQSPTDFAIVNIDYPVSKEFLNLGQGHKLQVSTKQELNNGVFIANGAFYRRVGAAAERVVGLNEVGLIGHHNLENIAAAIGAATALGIGIGSIAGAIRNFKGLEHRLEFVRELSGVRYYNDSFSTTPETAIAAIKSFSEPEIIILGGSDKGSDYSELGKVISESNNIKGVILIGQMAPEIKKAIQKAGDFKGEFKEGAKDMKGIVEQARSLVETENVVILSPACASFDMFKNYKQRGNQFKEIVNQL